MMTRIEIRMADLSGERVSSTAAVSSPTRKAAVDSSCPLPPPDYSLNPTKSPDLTDYSVKPTKPPDLRDYSVNPTKSPDLANRSINPTKSETCPPNGQKKSAEGRKKKSTVYSSPLPPCKICGGKASGLHYGVNTCEACKGFFRRAIKYQRKYQCFRKQRCDVVGERSVRTSCPFCRLQKCLDMGMAHSAIKTGRYTHAKRTENIMEVKRLEINPNNLNGGEHAQDTGSSFSSNSNSNSCGSCIMTFNSSKNSLYDEDRFFSDCSTNKHVIESVMHKFAECREQEEVFASQGDGDFCDNHVSGHINSSILHPGGDVRNLSGRIKRGPYTDDAKIIPYEKKIPYAEENSHIGGGFNAKAGVGSYWSNTLTDSGWTFHQVETTKPSMENPFFGSLKPSDGTAGTKEVAVNQPRNSNNPSNDIRHDRYISQQNDHGLSADFRTHQWKLPQQSDGNQQQSHPMSFQPRSYTPYESFSQFHMHSQFQHHPSQQKQQQQQYHHQPNDHTPCYNYPKPLHLIPQFAVPEPNNSSGMPIYPEVNNGKFLSYQPGKFLSSSESLTSTDQTLLPIKIEPLDSRDKFENSPDIPGSIYQEEDNVEGVCISIFSPTLFQDVNVSEIDALEEAAGFENIPCKSCIQNAVKDSNDILFALDNITAAPSFSSSSVSSLVPVIYIDKSQTDVVEDTLVSPLVPAIYIDKSQTDVVEDTLVSPLVPVIYTDKSQTDVVEEVESCDLFSTSFISNSTSLRVSPTSAVGTSNLPISPSRSLSPSVASSPSPSLLASVTQKHKSGFFEEKKLPHAIPSSVSPQISSNSKINPLLISHEIQVPQIYYDRNAFLLTASESDVEDQDSKACTSVTCLKNGQIKSKEVPFGSSLDDNLFQGIVGIIEAAYHKYMLTMFDKNPDLLYKWQLTYLKQHKARCETFGLQTEFITDDDYEEIFKRTGLDIDNRREQISIIHRGTTKFFQDLSRFALEVPGFDKLHPGDMVELIYGSYVELWFLRSFSGVNSDLSVLIMPMGKPYTKSELAWVMSKEFADIVFEQAPSFKLLTLNSTIMALWKTVVLLASDRGSLKEPSRVCQLQQFYLDLLKHYTRHVWPGDPGLLTRLVDATIRLRDVGYHSKAPRSFTTTALKRDILEVVKARGLDSVSGDTLSEPSYVQLENSHNIKDGSLE